MSLRAVYGALALALVTFLMAGAVVVYVNVLQSRQQNLIVRFVCAAIEAREAAHSPDAQELARRYRAILNEIHEHCPS